MVDVLVVQVEGFLEPVVRTILQMYDTFVLFVTINTMVAHVLVVAPKCKEQIFR